MQRLAQFLAATGRKLSSLGKVIGHIFRKGKLGLKLAIKIPFFVEIEIAHAGLDPEVDIRQVGAQPVAPPARAPEG